MYRPCIKIRESLFRNKPELRIVVSYARGERYTPGARAPDLVDTMKLLVELWSIPGGVETVLKLKKKLSEAIPKQQEIAQIASALNGPHHAMFTGAEEERYLSRIKELDANII